jgi:tetratricopeptide (TPR) repeat protein
MPAFLRTVSVVTCLATAGLLQAASFDEAQALYRAKRYAEARDAFELVAAAEPNNAAAAYHLGQLALMRNMETEAIKWFEKATALAPQSASYYQALGDAYGLAAQKAGLFSKPGLARRCRLAYEKAVELEPENISARYALFTFFRQAPAIAGGGLDKARTQAEEIRKRDVIRGTIALAELSVVEKKFDEAFAALVALRRSHPEAWDAAYQIGRTAAMSGQRLDDGEAALKDYLARTPDEDEAPLWGAHWRLGQILEKKGDPAGARAEYQAALKLNPTQPQLLEAMKRVK